MCLLILQYSNHHFSLVLDHYPKKCCQLQSGHASMVLVLKRVYNTLENPVSAGRVGVPALLQYLRVLEGSGRSKLSKVLSLIWDAISDKFFFEQL